MEVGNRRIKTQSQIPKDNYIWDCKSIYLSVSVVYQLIIDNSRGVNDIMHVGDTIRAKIYLDCKLHAATRWEVCKTINN